MWILRKEIKKKLILLYSTVIISFLLLPAKAFAQDKWKTQEGFDFYAKTPINASLRSLLLPGWGQFFNQQKTKGYIITTTALAGITAAVFMYSKANNTYSEYEDRRDRGLIDDDLYDEYSEQLDTSRICGYVTAAVWTWGVIDAYLFASSSTTNAKRQEKEGLVFQLQGTKQFVLAYNKLF
ncbi:hypothetical protein KAI68_07585 [bacterium]|nr:hypothetical protein [bacterium]